MDSNRWAEDERWRELERALGAEVIELVDAPALPLERSDALRGVLAALAALPQGPALVPALITAARRASRSGQPPDPVGRALWRVVERRAVGNDPALGGGQPLPEAVRRTMERSLGVALGAVRIHADAVAADAARAVRAAAFTVGNDIFFAAGAYAPETTHGRRLLAQELAHVVQHRHRRVDLEAVAD